MDRKSFDRLRTKKDTPTNPPRQPQKSHHPKKPAKETTPKIEAPERQADRTEETSPKPRKKVVVPIAAMALLGVAIAGLFLYWHLSRTTSVKKVKHCTSKACKLATVQYEAMINKNIDPCKNFYMYACGGWLAGRSKENSYVEEIYEAISEDAHTFLYDRQLGVAAIDPFWNLVTFYRSCYDFVMVNQTSLDEIRKTKRYLQTEEWLRYDASTLLEPMIRLSLAKGISTAFDIRIRRWKSKYYVVIKLGESLSDMIMPTANKFRPKDVMHYVSSILEAVIQNGTEPFTRALIKFEANFQKQSRQSRKSSQTLLNYASFPIIPGQLDLGDWKRAIEVNLVDASKIEGKVYVHDMSALTNVTKELFSVDSKLRVSFLSLLAITNIFRYRVQREHGRDTCVSLAMEHFPENTVYLLSEKRIVSTLQNSFTKFIQSIQRQVIKEIAKATWMTTKHFEAIRNKMKEIDLRVPETLPPLVSKDVPKMSPEFTKNYIDMSEYTRGLQNKYLKFSTHFSRALRAGVRIEDDDLEITNAIMWTPWFYDQKDDAYINYATVGVRVAIELMKFLMKEYIVLLPELKKKWKGGVSCMLRQTKLPRMRSGDSFLGAAYEVARGTSVALGLASPLPDSNAKRLFFGRLCQQYCDRRDDTRLDTTDLNIMKPSLLCEFSVRQQPLFWEAFDCRNFSGNCTIT
ncbi:uncharacterized protein LOC135368526 [Ornithodoros turicata]|uniref:uncharacterized protein LOC135368526 n=1 Tax=Ornithodoros turicata TaxID=34597 RepID=UPI0031398763